MSNTLILLRNDFWGALYVDGRKTYEGDDLTGVLQDCCEKSYDRAKVDVLVIDEMEVDELPDTLAELQQKYGVQNAVPH